MRAGARMIAALGAVLAPWIAAAQIESSALAPPGGMAPAPAPEFKRPFSPSGPQLPDRIAPLETEERPGVRIAHLDKITGETRTVEIAAGESVTLAGRLEVRALRCLAPPEGTRRGTKAFLEIRDRGPAGADAAGGAPAFRGWMFAESPALSALDHPRYDVWVTSCTTSAGGVASGSE